MNKHINNLLGHPDHSTPMHRFKNGVVIFISLAACLTAALTVIKIATEI